ncbi:hypothetical protein Tco_0091364 [Tanacetum coccineum]
MTTLQFADTYNLVMFLAKPAESEGFEQIVDFLNAHTINYALTVNPTIYTSCIKQFWATVKAKTINREVQLQAVVDGKKIIITEASIRSDLQLNDEEGMDCLPNATIFEELTRMGSENVSKFSNDPLLARVIDLEKTKSAQAQEITSLKLRVKKLEKKGGSRTHKLKRLYKVGRSARIVSSDEASLGRYGDYMFDVSDLAGEEVFVAEQGVSDKDVNLSVDEVTLAQALAALKSAKVQEKANVVEEPSESITTTPTLYNNKLLLQHLLLISTRPVGKGLVIHDEEQAIHHSFSQQSAHAKIQDKVEFDEQERIEREKAEANIALKETWDDIQAKIKADCLLAERLQAREQEELTIEERAILFQQLLEKRRKHFVAKRAKEKRNRPPTKAQQRSIMCTYLKNMEGWKHKDLKRKSFENIQELFDKAMKRVNTFVDYRTELVERSLENGKAEIAQESSSKRAGDELEEESIKSFANYVGVVRFGKKGKLSPRFVIPFEIIEKVGPVAYQLDLPEELNGVHDTFHVSNLKKCLPDPKLQVPLDEIQVDAKLNFMEESVEILEKEFKKLKRSRIAIVKVRWNSKCGPEFTWEREDQMKLKYPHLFSDVSC